MHCLGACYKPVVDLSGEIPYIGQSALGSIEASHAGCNEGLSIENKALHGGLEESNHSVNQNKGGWHDSKKRQRRNKKRFH